MEKEKQERITLYLDKVLKKNIENVAKKEERSVNNFILFHLKKYIVKQKVNKK